MLKVELTKNNFFGIIVFVFLQIVDYFSQFRFWIFFQMFLCGVEFYLSWNIVGRICINRKFWCKYIYTCVHYKGIHLVAIKSFCSIYSLRFRKSCRHFRIVVMGGMPIFKNIISSQICKSGHFCIRKFMFIWIIHILCR